jgi:hypothetical protein
LPKSGSYPALIARARAIIETATPIQASFIDAGLPATFITELQALLAAFENATMQKYDGRITQVLNTAALKARVNLGVNAATILDACARNHFRNNPEMLAAWSHARHIERSSRRSTGPQMPATASSGHSNPVDSTQRSTPENSPLHSQVPSSTSESLFALARDGESHKGGAAFRADDSFRCLATPRGEFQPHEPPEGRSSLLSET